MEFKTLKKLIRMEFENSESFLVLEKRIMGLLDLYETETQEDSSLIPYHSLCGCNPKNGGSGVCGCGIGNVPVNSLFKKEIYESARKEREKFKPKV